MFSAYVAPDQKIPFFKRRKPVIVNSLVGLSDIGDDTSSPSTSVSDYLKMFSNTANQALSTYVQLAQAARAADQSARANPAPPPPVVQQVSNFSRTNTKPMLWIAGGLAALLIVPRLMRR